MQSSKVSNIYRAGARIAALAFVVLCIASCENENMFEKASNRFNIIPVFKSQNVLATRALASGDYVSFAGVAGDYVQAYAQEMSSGDAPVATGTYIDGDFTKATTKWNSGLEVEAGKSYNIYAFMTGGAGTGTFSHSADNSKITLTVDDIDIVAKGDPCIAVSAAKEEADLTIGSFLLKDIKTADSEVDTPDVVYFAMNHLYAKATLNFKIDASDSYKDIRTIAVYDIRLKSATGKTSLSVTIGENAITYGDYGAKNIEIAFLDSIKNRPVVLTTTATTAGSFCFVPKRQDVQQGDLPIPVSLEIHYNVYQDNDTTKLIRGKQTAVNKNILLKNKTPQVGTNYPITVNVKPTYLYVLTDEDGKVDLEIN